MYHIVRAVLFKLHVSLFHRFSFYALECSISCASLRITVTGVRDYQVLGHQNVRSGRARPENLWTPVCPQLQQDF
jgi:hypothetical protein